MTKTTKITLRETLSYSIVLCSVSFMRRKFRLMRKGGHVPQVIVPIAYETLKPLFISLSPRAGKKLTFVRGVVEEEFVAMCCTG